MNPSAPEIGVQPLESEVEPSQRRRAPKRLAPGPLRNDENGFVATVREKALDSGDPQVNLYEVEVEGTKEVAWLREAFADSRGGRDLERESKVLGGPELPLFPKPKAPSFTQDGNVYLATPPLWDEGDEWTLADLLAKPDQPLEPIFSLLVQVAGGLAALHRRDWAHLGLHPKAVALGKPLRILDLSHAAQLGEPVGDPFFLEGYSAPELADRNAVADIRMDVYAVGALLYQAVAGEPVPLTGAELVAWQPARLVPGVPAILHRCLGSPESRYDTMGKLQADLRRLVDRYDSCVVHATGSAIRRRTAGTGAPVARGCLSDRCQTEEGTRHCTTLCVASGEGAAAAVQQALHAAVSETDPTASWRALARRDLSFAAAWVVDEQAHLVQHGKGSFSLARDGKVTFLPPTDKPVPLQWDQSLLVATERLPDLKQAGDDPQALASASLGRLKPAGGDHAVMALRLVKGHGEKARSRLLDEHTEPDDVTQPEDPLPRESWWEQHRAQLVVAGKLAAGAAAVAALAVSAVWGVGHYRTRQAEQQVTRGKTLLATTQATWNRSGKSEPDPRKLQPLLASLEEAGTLLKGQPEAVQAQVLSSSIRQRLAEARRIARTEPALAKARTELGGLESSFDANLPKPELRAMLQNAVSIRDQLGSAAKLRPADPSLKGDEQRATQLVRKIDRAIKIVVVVINWLKVRQVAQAALERAQQQLGATRYSSAQSWARAAHGGWKRYLGQFPNDAQAKQKRDEAQNVMEQAQAGIVEQIQAVKQRRKAKLADAKAGEARGRLDAIETEWPNKTKDTERKELIGRCTQALALCKEALTLVPGHAEALAQKQRAQDQLNK